MKPALKREPWDQRHDETELQYQWFCIYRDLGPRRSRLLAWSEYQRMQGRLEAGAEPGQPSGAFNRAISDNDWFRRAILFDFREMSGAYVEITRDYLRGVKAAAAQAAEAAENTTIDDPNWPVILETLAFVGKHLEPAAASGALVNPDPASAHAADRQDQAQPALSSAPRDSLR